VAAVSALRTAGRRTDFAVPAVLTMVLVCAQITLGGFIIWTQRQPHVTSTHVVTGALLLAVSFILTARTLRFISPTRKTKRSVSESGGAAA
jgi:cytochrome c oxidase assembly protein subunit 15